jgi:hypothetical protein
MQKVYLSLLIRVWVGLIMLGLNIVCPHKVTPYLSVIMVLSTFLQLSIIVKPTQVCCAPAGRRIISTTMAAPQWEL